MGSDLGMAEMARGAALAVKSMRDKEFDIIMVGTNATAAKRDFDAELGGAAMNGCRFELVQADEELPKRMDSPVEVYKSHPRNSIRVAMELAKKHTCSAVISPGNTGLVMTTALFTLGRVKGVERTPIGTPMPTRHGLIFYVDGGSNVECRPQHLYQFAVLAHLYVKNILRIERPRIALLSNGAEEYKGNAQVKEAFPLLSADRELNFVGYTEGHSMLGGGVDIMVCDGFLGNILLKFAEGIAETIGGMMKDEIKREPLAAVAAKLFLGRAMGRLKRRMDYAQFGGAPLLGLNGNVVISHGRSSAEAIKNALRVGYEMAQANISEQVARHFESHMAAGS
jgi:phosphate acyltransferase